MDPWWSKIQEPSLVGPCNAHGSLSFYMRPFTHQASVAVIPYVALHFLAPVVLFVTMVHEASDGAAMTFSFAGAFAGTATVIRGMTFYYELDGELRGTQWFSRDHRTFLFVSAWGEMYVWAEDPDIEEDFVFMWMSYRDWFATARRVPTALLRPPPPHVDQASQPPQVD